MEYQKESLIECLGIHFYILQLGAENIEEYLEIIALSQNKC